jgi:hypothetical protein
MNPESAARSMVAFRPWWTAIERDAFHRARRQVDANGEPLRQLAFEDRPHLAIGEVRVTRSHMTSPSRAVKPITFPLKFSILNS